jgi:predicted HTH transcriptional regulator
MRTLGYVQHFGIGIQIARDALARNGNPPPEFRVGPRTIIATIRRATNQGPAVLAYLESKTLTSRSR